MDSAEASELTFSRGAVRADGELNRLDPDFGGLSMPRTRLAAPLLLLLAALAPSPAQADESDVLPPKPMIRQFPQGTFCALPVTISFVAPATPVKVTFTALQWADAGFGLQFTDQAIDNVTIATTAQVVPNTVGQAIASGFEDCYIELFPTPDLPPVEYFHFNRAGLTLNLLEQFDSGAIGWDLTHGAVFTPGRTAAHDVEDNSGYTGGSLVIGDGLGTPAAGETKSTSFTISSLTAGTSYDFGAWWDVNVVRAQYDTTYLTITVTTDSGVPIARRSWGEVKKLYR